MPPLVPPRPRSPLRLRCAPPRPTCDMFMHSCAIPCTTSRGSVEAADGSRGRACSCGAAGGAAVCHHLPAGARRLGGLVLSCYFSPALSGPPGRLACTRLGGLGQLGTRQAGRQVGRQADRVTHEQSNSVWCNECAIPPCECPSPPPVRALPALPERKLVNVASPTAVHSFAQSSPSFPPFSASRSTQ